MKLASFDIFDTTLIRKCGNPAVIVEQLADRLFPTETDLKEAFILWRKQATGETLADIYAAIDSSFLAFHTLQQMMQTEKDVEAECLTVNPPVRALIEKKRKEGCPIAFISDMYLDSAFLREVLKREGCLQPEDYVYISCEHKARKDNGTLYDKVKAELHPDIWIHYGDNLRSDVKIARKKGITAVRIMTGYNEAETAQQAYSSVDTELLTALSRLHRLQHGDTPFNTFAADFVAPAYLPYVIFVLSEAERRGIKRLYFLSRDSYVLLKAAQALHHKYAGIELKYLFVSRRSLLLPYLYGEGREAYLAASDHHTIIRIDTVDKRLKQLGTSREEMREQYGIVFDYVKVGNLKQQDDFLEKIFNSPFTPTLQARARQQEDLLMRYLEQEGLTDGEKCAAVDVGWLGTSRLMMNSILRRHGMNDLEMFYYGIRKDVFPPSAGRYTSFFRAGELSTEATGLLENYYSASPYPTTIGYKQSETGVVFPVFPNGQEFRETAITRANVDAMENMAEELIQFNLLDCRKLYTWAKLSIKSAFEGKVRIDFKPLMKCNEFDDAPFVKRLTPIELVRLILLGESVTAFDRASLRLTLPRQLQGIAWQLSRTTGQIKGILYREYIAKKQRS